MRVQILWSLLASVAVATPLPAARASQGSLDYFNSNIVRETLAPNLRDDVDSGKVDDAAASAPLINLVEKRDDSEGEHDDDAAVTIPLLNLVERRDEQSSDEDIDSAAATFVLNLVE